MADKSRASVWERGFLILILLTAMCWLVACGGVPPSKASLTAVANVPSSLPATATAGLRDAAEATIAAARSTIEAAQFIPTRAIAATPTPTAPIVPLTPTSQPQPTESPLNRPINWTVPQRLGPTVGVTRQLLLDRTGRLWAIWEEHPGLDPQSPPTAIRYCIWDGEKWGAMKSIPGSDNMTETAATVLDDGSILVKGQLRGSVQQSGTPPSESYAWFRWDVAGRWFSVPEMALTTSMSGVGPLSIISDRDGLVHLMRDPVLAWDGETWRQTGRLAVDCLSKTALTTDGIPHVIGLERNNRSLRHWAWDGKTWSDRGAVYVSPDEVSMLRGCPALAAGSDGTLHAVWETSVPPAGDITSREATPHWLSYSRGNGSEWTAARILFGPIQESGSWELDAAVLPDGTVVVVWSDVTSSEGEQLYATWGRETTWIEPTLLPRAPGYTQRGVVAAVDAQGQPHIIWESGNNIYHSLGSRQ